MALPGACKRVLHRALGLPQPLMQATYVWVDGSGENVRAKTRTLEGNPTKPADFPKWNFDGSSTGQAVTGKSDVILRPVAVYADPLSGGANRLVLCSTWNADRSAHATNTRLLCEQAMTAAERERPWFGMEQEYMLVGLDGRPIGTGLSTKEVFAGKSYCGVGAGNVYGRDVVEAHYRACLHAGIQLAGTNAEVALGQWEFQVGPCAGIEMGDQLWMARFLLHRVAEECGVRVDLDPKPVADVNGSGMHTNFSTERMRRSESGLAAMWAAVERMRPKHAEHMAEYGTGNERRMTGMHETAPMDVFSAGVGDRGASIRIPQHCAQQGFGYVEDRRPGSNADPYRVSRVIVQTCVIDADIDA